MSIQNSDAALKAAQMPILTLLFNGDGSPNDLSGNVYKVATGQTTWTSPISFTGSGASIFDGTALTSVGVPYNVLQQQTMLSFIETSDPNFLLPNLTSISAQDASNSSISVGFDSAKGTLPSINTIYGSQGGSQGDFVVGGGNVSCQFNVSGALVLSQNITIIGSTVSNGQANFFTGGSGYFNFGDSLDGNITSLSFSGTTTLNAGNAGDTGDGWATISTSGCAALTSVVFNNLVFGTGNTATVSWYLNFNGCALTLTVIQNLLTAIANAAVASGQSYLFSVDVSGGTNASIGSDPTSQAQITIINANGGVVNYNA